MALGGGITPAWMLTTNKRKVIMTKIEKLIDVLERAANAVTPNEDGLSPSDERDVVPELAYRVGRALTLARDIARKS